MPKKSIWDYPTLDTDGVEPRQTTCWEYRCYADPQMFEDDWETTISPEDKEILDAQQGLPCDGGGLPGSWCTRCYWGKDEMLDECV